jgi:hypothetical protein
MSAADLHPGQGIPDGHVFIQPWPAGPSSKRRDQVIYDQFRADRARRTLRPIDEQVAKAVKAVAGLAPVKRNRFIALEGAIKSVNRQLEAKARDLAGLKGTTFGNMGRYCGQARATMSFNRLSDLATLYRSPPVVECLRA